MIGEGHIAPEKLAQLLVLADDKAQHKADVLTAVFVHAENTSAMTNALAKASTNAPTRLSSTSTDLKSQLYTLDLASIKPAELVKVLTSARDVRALVVIEASSLDQIIDATRKIGNINQLAFLNPTTPKLEAYFKQWTQSAVFSSREFLPSTPSCTCSLNQRHRQIELTIE